MIKVLAGSHSEVSAQLVRKGLFLGGFALWGLFLYPLYLVSCKFRVGRRQTLDLLRGFMD